MGHTTGEIPQVTLLEVVNEVAALVVDTSDADLPVEDIAPLGLLVPVELADDTLAEAHVDAGELAGGGQLADGRLAGPSSFLDPDVRVREAPAHVGHVAMVGAGRADQVGVLAGATRVPGAEYRLAQAVAPWEGVDAVLVGVNGAIEVIAVARTVGVLGGGLGLEGGTRAGQVLFRELQAGSKALLRRVLVGGSPCQARQGGRQEDL